MGFTRTEDGIYALVAYGVEKGLIEREDVYYAANSLLDVCKYEPDSSFEPEEYLTTREAQKKKAAEEAEKSARAKAEHPDDVTNDDIYAGYDPAGEEPDLESILKFLLDDAVKRGVIEDGIASRDLFDTRMMGCLTPRPSEVIRVFKEKYEKSPKEATDYFYKLSCDSDYIRTYRVKKDLKWVTKTKYGDLDITINLSKPEKDPKAIAAALKKKSDSYPKCLLCPENEGYAGRLDHPARETIRLIPLTLGGQQWYMQYSPYVYYNEHCIVLSGEHVPMKIDRGTFTRLMQFIQIFPHYTIGSNADLPIVGGSILTHEHFQGGHYTFAMAKAGLREKVSFKGYEDIKTGIVNWPMSVIRLDGTDPERMVELADKILTAWRGYSDSSVDILAETDGTPHNTITPIARMHHDETDGEEFELDLVLRNNRTTEEYPLGIFHPHQNLHHIKKENIGLIEVMGLAVLPARLRKEMTDLKMTILAGRDPAADPSIASHAAWTKEILEKHPEYQPENVRSADPMKLDEILKEEIGLVFSQVLEDAGVYKDTDEGHQAFHRFVDAV